MHFNLLVVAASLFCLVLAFLLSQVLQNSLANIQSYVLGKQIKRFYGKGHVISERDDVTDVEFDEMLLTVIVLVDPILEKKKEEEPCFIILPYKENPALCLQLSYYALTTYDIGKGFNIINILPQM